MAPILAAAILLVLFTSLFVTTDVINLFTTSFHSRDLLDIGNRNVPRSNVAMTNIVAKLEAYVTKAPATRKAVPFGYGLKLRSTQSQRLNASWHGITKRADPDDQLDPEETVTLTL